MPPFEARQAPRSFRDRWAAMRNVPPLLRLVWRAGPGLALATIVLRLTRALISGSRISAVTSVPDTVTRCGPRSEIA